MSYYRYITGVYKSYWPELNRTLRSSSVPRSVPDPQLGRYARGSSMPPQAYFTDSPSTYVTSSFYSSRRAAASPFKDRALSVPREVVYTPPTRSYIADSHYTDFDCKVMAYSAQLDMQDTARQQVSQHRHLPCPLSTDRQYLPSDYRRVTGSDYRDYLPATHRVSRNYPSDSFSARYDYYDGNKHGTDGLYPCSREVLGTWKHFNRSAETLNARNSRARSPLISRELDRYYETKKRSNYIGEISMGGATDFRYYNYRKVPYFGGSDNYCYMKQKPGARRI